MRERERERENERTGRGEKRITEALVVWVDRVLGVYVRYLLPFVVT